MPFTCEYHTLEELTEAFKGMRRRTLQASPPATYTMAVGDVQGRPVGLVLYINPPRHSRGVSYQLLGDRDAEATLYWKGEDGMVEHIPFDALCQTITSLADELLTTKSGGKHPRLASAVYLESEPDEGYNDVYVKYQEDGFFYFCSVGEDSELCLNEEQVCRVVAFIKTVLCKKYGEYKVGGCERPLGVSQPEPEPEGSSYIPQLAPPPVFIY